MGKLSVSTLVTLDGVIQDRGGFGGTEQGGWGNPYFTARRAADRAGAPAGSRLLPDRACYLRPASRDVGKHQGRRIPGPDERDPQGGGVDHA